MTIDAEVIVVGLGVGGEFMAGRLAEAGLDVVGIESALAGGDARTGDAFPVAGQAVHRPLERAELATSCPCPHGNPMIATGPRYAAGKTSPPPAANTG